MNLTDRAWAEINLDAVCHNLNEIRKITDKSVKIMAMVKSDAYGHGVTELAKNLIENGVDYLGVACPTEALEIIEKNIKARILIVGYTVKERVCELIKNDVEMTVFELSDAEYIDSVAKKLSKKAKIHIKLDTGMTRIGVPAYRENAVEIIKNIAALQNIEIIGMFTHFAKADEEGEAATKEQFDLFMEVANAVEKEGIHIPIKHVCNSAAAILYPYMHLDMVRPGLSIYGAYPSKYVKNNTKIALREAMSLKSRIIRIENVEEGREVSYGGTYKTKKEEKLATISIGYGDGYPRKMSNTGRIFINGKNAHIAGKVCMDQCVINIDGISAKKEDEVILMGENAISVEELAEKASTISYEVYCGISKRVPRIYTRD